MEARGDLRPALVVALRWLPARQRAVLVLREVLESGGGRRLHTVQVLTVAGGRVARSVVFADPRVLSAFASPAPAAGAL
ncbi:hypothetical protein [Streptomyces sp. CoH27]|uniref:hypothetical protein n=1 Tax=Streptomyces sp. CoH27 TaxID=2875763 RepID=UPI001CD391AA|nr:hypothetical protein [Streptomyces sp. CoH27]